MHVHRGSGFADSVSEAVGLGTRLEIVASGPVGLPWKTVFDACDDGNSWSRWSRSPPARLGPALAILGPGGDMIEERCL